MKLLVAVCLNENELRHCSFSTQWLMCFLCLRNIVLSYSVNLQCLFSFDFSLYILSYVRNGIKSYTDD